jgi:hypothetical protein
VVDQRFESLYLFAACRPGTDETFARQLAPGVHAVLVLDQAGWHDARALHVPETITLLPLPPASPQLNPVERVWVYLRERYLLHRALDDYDAVLDTVCRAWIQLLDETGRLASLTAYSYLSASAIP